MEKDYVHPIFSSCCIKLHPLFCVYFPDVTVRKREGERGHYLMSSSLSHSFSVVLAMYFDGSLLLEIDATLTLYGCLLSFCAESARLLVRPWACICWFFYIVLVVNSSFLVPCSLCLDSALSPLILLGLDSSCFFKPLLGSSPEDSPLGRHCSVNPSLLQPEVISHAKW